MPRHDDHMHVTANRLKAVDEKDQKKPEKKTEAKTLPPASGTTPPRSAASAAVAK